MSKTWYPIIDEEKCIECSACPTQAITYFGDTGAGESGGCGCGSDGCDCGEDVQEKSSDSEPVEKSGCDCGDDCDCGGDCDCG